MKPAVLALTFLLFAFPVAFSNDAQPVPVLDITGKPVVSGSDYIIFTTLSGKLGFVTLGETGHSTSPATVEVSFVTPTDAIPVKFIANTPEIFTDTPLQIKFPKNYTHGLFPKWIVVGDSAIQQTYVGIGPRAHRGQPTYYGTFKILKSSDNNKYDLAFSLPIRVDELPVSWNIRLAFFNDTDPGLLILTGNEPGFGFQLIGTNDYPGIRTVV